MIRKLRKIPVVFGRLSLPLRVGSLLALSVLFVVAIFKGYQTYDYIEHDNDFCQGCHLMEDPFQRFSQSGHKDLWCKSCHHPNMIDRSKMALTQVLKQPTKIEHHAHVPNEMCAKCHIEGDPERWSIVSQTSGHRVHLESDKLEGLQCVKCHSVSLHEFVPVDRTCGQSDCHATTKVNLGKMAMESEMHCLACHDFLVEPRDRLKPRQEDCLACHEMKEKLGDLAFDSDPHQGRCADCHNAHTQTQPADAVQSCLKSGCHGEMVTVAGAQPTMHRGLGEAEFRNCLKCHSAHVWKIESVQCSDCHDQTSMAGQVYGRSFNHGRHSEVACANCHDTENSHGRLALDGVLDCTGCHHDPAQPAARCNDCHSAAELAAKPYDVSMQISLSVRPEPEQREYSFRHDVHTSQPCAACHDTNALHTGSSQHLTTDCASCHESHHTAGNNCSSCHPADIKSRHTRSAHLDCSAAGCHAAQVAVEFATIADACLVCHSDRRKHEPDSNCRACHFPSQPNGESR